MAWGDPFFAWVNEGETFNPLLHKRSDEEIETVELAASEDGFAMLTLLVKPPEGGMLNPARKRWGLLSYEKGDGTLVLLARGKVDSFPLGGDPEEAEIRFKCAPGDWEAAQNVVLQASKTGAHWDPVLVAPESRDDPVEILDGQSKVIDFHPATHACALHDILGVGLPTWDVGLNWYDDSLEAENAEPPVSVVEVEVSAQWTQRQSGVLFLKNAIEAAFGGMPNTLTAEDFQNRWPRVGDGIGNDNGYVVRTSELVRAYPDGESLEAGPFQGSSDVYNYVTDSQLTAPIARDVMLERAWYDAELSLNWSAEQARHERILIRMTSGVQDPGLGNGGVRRISLECQDVTVDETTAPWQPDTSYGVGDVVRVGGRNWKRLVAGISAASWAADFTAFDMETFPPTLVQNWERETNDGSPVGGPDRAAYFPIVRGARTLLAACMRGRAVLVESMRCDEVTVQVPLDDAVEAGLCLGMSVQLTVPEGRLAIEGSTVKGKVFAYTMRISADEDVAEIVIRCAQGSGKATAAPAGSNSSSPTGQAWDVIALPDVSGLPVRQMATGGIVRVRVIGGDDEQAAYLNDNDYSPPDRTDKDATNPAKLLGDVPTYLVFDLVPLAADDEILLEAEVETVVPFEGPKQIDLGAE